MKKTIVWLLAVTSIIFSLHTSVLAHSGRTDGSGGHIDHSTGKYHYHHGYSAHNHRDMDGDGDKDCPYEFDDKTDYDISYSGNDDTYHYSNATETTMVTKEVPYIPPWVYWLLGGLAVALCVSVFVIMSKNKELGECYENISSCRREISSIKKQMKTAEENAIAPYVAKVNALESQVASAQRQLSDANADLGKKREIIQNMLKAPDRTQFAEDGLPIFWNTNKDKPYGDYTVFYSSKSNIYHADRYCAACGSQPEHIFNIKGKGRPCKKCVSGFLENISIPDWFETK